MSDFLNIQTIYHPPVVLPAYISCLEHCLMFFDFRSASTDAYPQFHPKLDEMIEIAFSAPQTIRFISLTDLESLLNLACKMSKHENVKIACLSDLYVSLLLRAALVISKDKRNRKIDPCGFIHRANNIVIQFQGTPIYDRLRFMILSANLLIWIRKEMWPMSIGFADDLLQLLKGGAVDELFPPSMHFVVDATIRLQKTYCFFRMNRMEECAVLLNSLACDLSNALCYRPFPSVAPAENAKEKSSIPSTKTPRSSLNSKAGQSNNPNPSESTQSKADKPCFINFRNGSMTLVPSSHSAVPVFSSAVTSPRKLKDWKGMVGIELLPITTSSSFLQHLFVPPVLFDPSFFGDSAIEAELDGQSGAKSSQQSRTGRGFQSSRTNTNRTGGSFGAKKTNRFGRRTTAASSSRVGSQFSSQTARTANGMKIANPALNAQSILVTLAENWHGRPFVRYYVDPASPFHTSLVSSHISFAPDAKLASVNTAAGGNSWLSGTANKPAMRSLSGPGYSQSRSISAPRQRASMYSNGNSSNFTPRGRPTTRSNYTSTGSRRRKEGNKNDEQSNVQSQLNERAQLLQKEENRRYAELSMGKKIRQAAKTREKIERETVRSMLSQLMRRTIQHRPTTQKFSRAPKRRPSNEFCIHPSLRSSPYANPLAHSSTSWPVRPHLTFAKKKKKKGNRTSSYSSSSSSYGNNRRRGKEAQSSTLTNSGWWGNDVRRAGNGNMSKVMPSGWLINRDGAEEYDRYDGDEGEDRAEGRLAWWEEDEREGADDGWVDDGGEDPDGFFIRREEKKEAGQGAQSMGDKERGNEDGEEGQNGGKGREGEENNTQQVTSTSTAAEGAEASKTSTGFPSFGTAPDGADDDWACSIAEDEKARQLRIELAEAAAVEAERRRVKNERRAERRRKRMQMRREGREGEGEGGGERIADLNEVTDEMSSANDTSSDEESEREVVSLVTPDGNEEGDGKEKNISKEKGREKDDKTKQTEEASERSISSLSTKSTYSSASSSASVSSAPADNVQPNPSADQTTSAAAEKEKLNALLSSRIESLSQQIASSSSSSSSSSSIGSDAFERKSLSSFPSFSLSSSTLPYPPSNHTDPSLPSSSSSSATSTSLTSSSFISFTTQQPHIASQSSSSPSSSSSFPSNPIKISPISFSSPSHPSDDGWMLPRMRSLLKGKTEEWKAVFGAEDPPEGTPSFDHVTYDIIRLLIVTMYNMYILLTLQKKDLEAKTFIRSHLLLLNKKLPFPLPFYSSLLLRLDRAFPQERRSSSLSPTRLASRSSADQTMPVVPPLSLYCPLSSYSQSSSLAPFSMNYPHSTDSLEKTTLHRMPPIAEKDINSENGLSNSSRHSSPQRLTGWTNSDIHTKSEVKESKLGRNEQERDSIANPADLLPPSSTAVVAGSPHASPRRKYLMHTSDQQNNSASSSSSTSSSSSSSSDQSAAHEQPSLGLWMCGWNYNKDDEHEGSSTSLDASHNPSSSSSFSASLSTSMFHSPLALTSSSTSSHVSSPLQSSSANSSSNSSSSSFSSSSSSSLSSSFSTSTSTFSPSSHHFASADVSLPHHHITHPQSGESLPSFIVMYVDNLLHDEYLIFLRAKEEKRLREEEKEKERLRLRMQGARGRRGRDMTRRVIGVCSGGSFNSSGGGGGGGKGGGGSARSGAYSRSASTSDWRRRSYAKDRGTFVSSSSSSSFSSSNGNTFYSDRRWNSSERGQMISRGRMGSGMNEWDEREGEDERDTSLGRLVPRLNLNENHEEEEEGGYGEGEGGGMRSEGMQHRNGANKREQNYMNSSRSLLDSSSRRWNQSNQMDTSRSAKLPRPRLPSSSSSSSLLSSSSSSYRSSSRFQSGSALSPRRGAPSPSKQPPFLSRVASSRMSTASISSPSSPSTPSSPGSRSRSHSRSLSRTPSLSPVRVSSSPSQIRSAALAASGQQVPRTADGRSRQSSEQKLPHYSIGNEGEGSELLAKHEGEEGRGRISRWDENREKYKNDRNSRLASRSDRKRTSILFSSSSSTSSLYPHSSFASAPTQTSSYRRENNRTSGRKEDSFVPDAVEAFSQLTWREKEFESSIRQKSRANKQNEKGEVNVHFDGMEGESVKETDVSSSVQSSAIASGNAQKDGIHSKQITLPPLHPSQSTSSSTSSSSSFAPHALKPTHKQAPSSAPHLQRPMPQKHSVMSRHPSTPSISTSTRHVSVDMPFSHSASRQVTSRPTPRSRRRSASPFVDRAATSDSSKMSPLDDSKSKHL